MPPQQAIIDAERIARAAIRDPGNRPVYVVTPAVGTMMTPEIIGDYGGFFQPHLDLILRPQLERQGRWRGPGICVVVNAQSFFDDSRCPDNAYRRVVGTVLHEIAHWVDHRESPATRDAIERPLSSIDDERKVAEQFVERVLGPTFPEPLVSHGEGFSRACCHLRHRAKLGGCDLQFGHLHFGHFYSGLEMLHACSTYAEALRDEMARLQHLPLREAMALAPPDEYTRLWNRTYRRNGWSAAAAILRKRPSANLLVTAADKK